MRAPKAQSYGVQPLVTAPKAWSYRIRPSLCDKAGTFASPLYKAEKPSVCPSVHNFLVKWISAVAPWIGINLAQNESHPFWYRQVCFKKFLTIAVCRPQRFERQSVEDFCWKLNLHTSQTAAKTGLIIYIKYSSPY